jgi:hypothetical protein
MPTINERGIDFLSPRVRNYQSHPYAVMIADQLWVRWGATASCGSTAK